jgi:DNA-binding MarR family transcriptional regulator
MARVLASEAVAEALLLSLGLVVRELRQTRDETLTMPETSALGRLDKGGPTTVTELAKLERITAQSLGATLTALEERGLVQRTPDPDDGRRALIAITRAGGEKLRNRRSARSRQIARMLSEHFTGREREQLLSAAPLLERLAQHFKETP